jgi:phosphoglycerate dehydrogenase-like enzyme
MNIVVASAICPEALARLQRDHAVTCAWNFNARDLHNCVSDCEVLVFRSGVEISAELMGRAPKLQLLVRAGSGLDNLDMAYVHEQKLELVRIPMPGARAVAELTFGVMIMLARQILLADSELRKGHWLKHSLTGYLLKEKTLGIVGAGNIGAMIGEMASQWGMQAIGCVAHPDAAAAERLRRQQIRLATFHEVLAQADFLTLHVPLDQSTCRLIGPEELDCMKPGAYLINMARGGVVDEAALAQALTRSGGLAGAALDVHMQEGEGCLSPLAGLTNVILTPHVGATTIDSQREIGQQIIAAIADYECRGRRPADEPMRRYGND